MHQLQHQNGSIIAIACRSNSLARTKDLLVGKATSGVQAAPAFACVECAGDVRHINIPIAHAAQFWRRQGLAGPHGLEIHGEPAHKPKRQAGAGNFDIGDRELGDAVVEAHAVAHQVTLEGSQRLRRLDALVVFLIGFRRPTMVVGDTEEHSRGEAAHPMVTGLHYSPELAAARSGLTPEFALAACQESAGLCQVLTRASMGTSQRINMQIRRIPRDEGC